MMSSPPKLRTAPALESKSDVVLLWDRSARP